MYQFIIRNLSASSLPNVFQRNEIVISSNLDTRHPLVSTIHGLNTVACQSNESYCSVIIADILQIVTQIRHTLVPLSKRGGVPTFTVDRTLYCKMWITNSQNQSQIHSLFLLHIPSAGEPLAYSVGYFFTQSFVHWLAQKPLSITQTFSRSQMHTQLILFTNSIKIHSLDLTHLLSQSCHRSYTHSLVHSAIHSQIHFTRSLSIPLFTHSPIHRLSQSITFTFTQSFNQSQVRSRPSSVSHAFIHSDY